MEEDQAGPFRDTHRRLDARRDQVAEEDAHVIAARLKERHGRSEFRGEFRGDLEHIPQSLLIPSVNDPKLWLVRCKVAISIFNYLQYSLIF